MTLKLYVGSLFSSAWKELTSGKATRFPEVFASSATPPSEDVASQASVVLSHATLYPETASRLSSLQTLQVPSAEKSAQLNELTSEIRGCQHDQEQLNQEIRELRQRSARCLEWWVKVGVAGMGDMWEEWENRMVEVERQVARFEHRKREEEGYL